MTPLRFPSASYGKNAKSSEPGADRYQVLFLSEDFPTTARRALEHLATSVQWAGGGSAQRYEDCYALWPLAKEPGGALVARIVDAGCDRLRRPHALRVDAVYVESLEILDLPEQVGELMTSAAWPAKPWPGPPGSIELELGHVNPRVTAALEQAAAAGHALPRILVADHSDLRAHGFDRIIGLSASEDHSASKLVPSNVSWLVKPVPPRTIDAAPAARLTKHSRLLRPLSILLALGIAATVLLQLSTQQQLNGVERTLSGEILAHRDTDRRLLEFQQRLSLEREQGAQQSEELAEIRNIMRELKSTLDKPEAKFQSFRRIGIREAESKLKGVERGTEEVGKKPRSPNKERRGNGDKVHPQQ